MIAVEPSWTMIRQRAQGVAPVVRATAEHLPFRSTSFDVALAVLTIHHWADPVAGLRELARVARRQVVLTWDPSVSRRYWLLQEYLPEILEAEVDAATLSTVGDTLDVVEVTIVPVPADCTDGFLGAYWRRPHRYLDPAVRGAISGIAQLEESVVRRAMRKLEKDLADGTWDGRHGQLLAHEEIDLGYRLVQARARAVPHSRSS